VETAEHRSMGHDDTAIHYVSSVRACRGDDSFGESGSLVDEIDSLRRSMTEAFLREMSFTSEPVIEISRLLDVKINEYMKQTLIAR